jgi:hypothetical protein
MEQGALIRGYYRCDNCGDTTAPHVRQSRRWRLCDRCWAAIVPEDWGDTAAVARYWQAYAHMAQLHPTTVAARAVKASPPPRDADSLNPLCRCGRARQPIRAAADAAGLFGGPYHHLCPVCQAEAQISVVIGAAQRLHPDWDDEDWLDMLERAFPQAFAAGVLPDYWLRRREERHP